MANKDHLHVIKQGVSAWNRWRKDHPDIRPDLSDADFCKMNLRGIQLQQAILCRANFSQATLISADLREADLQYANLQSTIATCALFDKANLCDANAYRAWFSDSYFNEARFDRAMLYHAFLNNTHFQHASLQHANVIGAEIHYANFEGASLQGALLKHVNFSNSSLIHANLSNADLTEAIFNRTNLSHANFTQATMGWTLLTHVQLQTVVGLDTVNHVGPSEISLNTLYLSQGAIAEPFLRGIGVPDMFLTTSYPSFTSHTLRHTQTIYILCSSEDEILALQIQSGLQREGFRCWISFIDTNFYYGIWETSNALYVPLFSKYVGNSIDKLSSTLSIAQEKARNESRKAAFPVIIDTLIQNDAIALLKGFHLDPADFSSQGREDAHRHVIRYLLEMLLNNE